MLFVGHGSPMNAIQNNLFTRGWKALGKALPKPRAILSISAHFETQGSYVTASPSPQIIYDFQGFPEELYRVQYPAPGDPELAARICKASTQTKIEPTEEWGIDHGTWSVLVHLFPEATIPVLQISMDRRRGAAALFDLGRALRFLREEEVLLLGTGNLVHSFAFADFQSGLHQPFGFDWAERANALFKSWILENQNSDLLRVSDFQKEAKMAVPTPEHFLPILFLQGARNESDQIEFWNDFLTGGSFSMTSVLYKS